MDRRTILTIVALTLLNLVVFGQTIGFSFVNYDDGQFIFENVQVRRGLTAESVRWALTSAQLGYYPLTWLTHMIDVELYGLAPGGHHASGLLFHSLSTIILYLALRRLTKRDIESAVVAALFAIHPLHVESVAWVAERKDTLSTFFGMLALAAYPRRMALVALAMAASLASKQMLVTLPFALLLLDYWPLQRKDWMRAVVEKIPLFVLSIAGSVIAVVGQRQLNAIQSTAAIPVSDRIANAVTAYAAYVGQLFWPVSLGVYYPYVPVTTAASMSGAIVVLGISAAAVAWRKTAPYLLVGWLWFLGTLVPVIGLVQIGGQSMADRYTYVPYIGLFIALVWGVSDLAARLKVSRPALAAATMVVIAVLAAVAWKQTTYWRNSETLFTRALSVTGPNGMMEYSLGHELQHKEPDRALRHLRRAAEIASERSIHGGRIHAQMYVGIGTALLMKAREERNPSAASAMIDEAAAAYQRAITIDPAGTGNARRNLALAAQMKAQTGVTSAPAESKDAQLGALFERGVRALSTRDFAAAIGTFQQAVALDPAAVDARIYLALALANAGRNGEAVPQLEEAKRLDAQRANAYVTKALRMPPADNNVDLLIARLR